MPLSTPIGLSSINPVLEKLSKVPEVNSTMDSFFSRLALSNERLYRLIRHFIFWFFWWLFMGLIYGFLYTPEGQMNLMRQAYIEALIFLPQHMVLSYGIIYLILPRFVFKGRYWLGITSVIFLTVMVAGISHIVANYVITPIREAYHIQSKPTALFFSLLAGLRGSMTVAGFAVAIKLVKLWYFKNVDNERLEKATLKAELEILKGQLHPHFMFNTLNSIYSLALKKSEHTAGTILKLSQLMRYMLCECDHTLVDLKREIEILYHYIELEKSRFTDRLDMVINMQGDFGGMRIPPLLLMPFVENSFKHGVNEMTEQAWISLDLRVEANQLKFKLMNGKPETGDISGHSSYVGLVNVQRRLNLLYPGTHELRITQDGDIFIVNLMLQLDCVKVPETL